MTLWVKDLAASETPAPGGRTRQALAAFAFLCAYVALEWISFIHELNGLPITPWNPGLGAVFALMIFAGPVYALVLFAGVVFAEIFVLRTNLQWPVIFGIAATIAAVYAGAAEAARRYFEIDVKLDHLRDVVALLGAGLFGALLAAVIFAIILTLGPSPGWSAVTGAVIPLFVGDMIGIAVVTPLLLRFLNRRELPAAVRPFAIETIFYALLIAAALWVVARAGTPGGFKFFYLLFVPVVLSAIRYGLDGACISLAIAQLGLVGVLQFVSADARTFTEFQLLMLAMTATGLIVGAAVSERERAERHARETEKLIKEKEAEAHQASRLTLVSGMASALAHEINQPMTAARALARSAQELIRKPDADIARADANITTMIAQVDHAGAIVRRIRDFLRRGHPRVSTVDAAGVIEDALVLADAEAKAKRIQLSMEASDALPSIFGDRVQLQQVVLNLIRNSMDAIGAANVEGGRIVIAARQISAPAAIEFSVLDNGPGIDERTATRLFEPLMTSKHEGLGLGLAICASIVESHGGKIRLHSGAAGATEFRFFIPTGDR